MRADQFYKQTQPVVWTAKHQKEFAIIAMEKYPFESCAYIIDGKLVEVQNISKNPTQEFELSLQDSLLALKAQAFIHSHPDGPAYPSEGDMISQYSSKIPFGIITCTSDSASLPLWMHDNNLNIALEERPFIHGIFDCYSLIRAYYKQTRNVILPDFPREYEWWEVKNTINKVIPAANLYMDNFEKANFKAISKTEEMKEGDVILMDIQTGVISHAAVYLGNGLLLHHLRGRISKKDHAPSWKKFYNTVVRYNG